MNVFVDNLGESSIKMGVRCYVKTENYWTAKWEITENIKKKFDENNIVIPFNQLQISVNQQKLITYYAIIIICKYLMSI